MPTICPTVLAEDKDSYRSQIEKVGPFALRVQIDLADGQFAPVKTINIDEIWWPHTVRADLHLMYKNPVDFWDEILKLSPSMVIVHAEAELDHQQLAKNLRNEGILAGLAILKETSVASVEQLLPEFDHLLIFSGDLGHFGGTTDLSLLSKIDEAKAINPALEIGWDGGVSDENIKSLVTGGVDVLNVGGYIQNSQNPANAYATLNSIITSDKDMNNNE